MKNIILALILSICYLTLSAENKSKLVVGVTLTNFYPEWFAMYSNELSENGIKRIIHQGQQLNASYDYFYSQSGVDHATIYTGLLPEEHGIIAHDWYDRLRKQRINNVSSNEYKEVGIVETIRSSAPEHIQALSLGCLMKMNNAFSKVFSVAINSEEAVLSGGTCADLSIWYNENSGNWTSSNYFSDYLPDWLREHNRNFESEDYVKKGWMPLAEDSNSLLGSKLKSRVGLNNNFFYDISQVKKRFNNYKVLKGTPYVNDMVADVAEKLIIGEKLGVDNDPDLLCLSFSCLDYMNRDFGVEAKEFEDVLRRLDKNIEKLFSILDSKVGKGNYTIFLTFSETRELLPEELNRMKIKGGYFSIFKAIALLKSYLNLTYGAGDWITDFDAAQIYLNRELIEKNKLSLNEFQDRVADFLIDFEGIAKVITAHALTHNAFAEGSEKLVQNAFSAKRSGDILYTLLPAWIPELKDKEDFYFRYSKRSKIPVYFYGAGVSLPYTKECKITDITPTICEFIGITSPYTSKGKSLFSK